MYSIGDKLVYPMHGAGIIESIEIKEILGEDKQYYILKLPCDDMKVMIPTENSDDIGIRCIINKAEAEKVLNYFKEYTEDITLNWNKRYRENVAKMRSGDIFSVCQVVKTLMLRDKERGVSSGERKMLISAKQILISEIILVLNKTKEDVEQFLYSVIQENAS